MSEERRGCITIGGAHETLGRDPFIAVPVKTSEGSAYLGADKIAYQEATEQLGNQLENLSIPERLNLVAQKLLEMREGRK